MNAINPDKADKTHDPLCPKRSPIPWNGHSSMCVCDFIAYVRADERQRRYRADDVLISCHCGQSFWMRGPS